jgi:conjugal transfer pilus assembly protein TraU
MLKTYGAALVAATLSVNAVYADDVDTGVDGESGCVASDVLTTGLISDICWSCIFPLTIAGITMFSSPLSDSDDDTSDTSSDTDTSSDDAYSSTGSFPLSSKPEKPSGAANDVVCVCTDDALPMVGIPIGMWVPSEIYETTMKPGCSSTLGGLTIGIVDDLYLGTSGDPTSDLEQQSFNHIHTFSYPIVMMMELFTKCEGDYSDIDLLYMSEIDPMWNDPTVSIYGNPMSVFGNSIVAQAACAADSISSSVGDPIDSLFWCGGTWTSTLSPYTGYEHAQGNVQFTSSTSLKLLAMDAARGLERRTVGDDAVCEPVYSPMLKRSHYRWSALWPRAEASRNHGSGESILRWGASRTVPGYAETPIYLRWDWVDCCAPVIGD